MKVTKRYIALIAAVASIGAIAPLGASAAMGQGNIVQTAAASGQFKTLLSLATTAGLGGTLEGKGPFTLFAPTDAAFAKVPKATLAELKRNRAKLKAVLLYHVLKGRLTAAKLMKMHSVQTLNGQSLTVPGRDGKVIVGGAIVLKADVGASNGVIHVINKVLIPR